MFVLPFTPPYEASAALATLAAHAIPGAEHTDPSARSHTRLFPDAAGPIAATVTFASDRIVVTADTDAAGAARLTPLLRRWLDLDADPHTVYRTLRGDPAIGRLVTARPGLRVIGYPDGFEAAVTTVLGQQVSVAACRTFAGRLTAVYGLPGPAGMTVFPTARALAAATPDELQKAVGLTGSRARTLHALAEACAAGLVIEPDTDHAQVRRRLLALHGIGPWSIDYLTVRVLGDRDAFVPGDLVLRKALGGITAKQAEIASAAWSPVRAYALFQLWTATAYAA
ncbi:MAG: DNA-3-methyladenine glycosylase 2 [Microbacteriaceae bacterium]|nr:MAG: DNA-3-methyladenine glycosylase 2 [Microbacteriaceae bacterium]